MRERHIKENLEIVKDTKHNSEMYFCRPCNRFFPTTYFLERELGHCILCEKELNGTFDSQSTCYSCAMEKMGKEKVAAL